MTKIEVNKKMIGKSVYVLNGRWSGTVVEVVDDETFIIIDDGGVKHKVDIFDIRAI